MVIKLYHHHLKLIIETVFLTDTNLNLALNKPAYQINTYGTEKAGIAVDGSFTDHTSTNSGESRQWWIVDLLKPQNISEIYVRFRNFGKV